MSLQETGLHLVESFDGHARAFVQIQQGCNHRCTFCIIPYGRGNSRSVPMGHLFQQIDTLVQKGYPEVVLTGVDITSYGYDLPSKPTLAQMLKRLFAHNKVLPRLRLSSIDPAEIDADLIQLFADEPRLMPHVHLSVQAGDNLILKRMKRRHLREDVLRVCAQLRQARPDIVFGADIITGFPTETEEMFCKSLALVEECNIAYLHVFPYSEREGTPAAKMPAVDKPIRKERAERLRRLGKQLEHALYLSHIGTTTSIVMEQNQTGRTPHFMPVKVAEPLTAGQLATVRLDRLHNNVIEGSLVL
jgi:threonylcarbamoyladenosine tRNA methylthiotransferase MtaB